MRVCTAHACMDIANSQRRCRILAFVDLVLTLIQLILALAILVPIIIGAVTDILFIQNREIKDPDLISVVELIILVLSVIAFSTQLWAAYMLLLICNPNANPKDDVSSSQIYTHASLFCIVLQVISLQRFRGPLAADLFSAAVLMVRFLGLFIVNRFKKQVMQQYSAVSVSSVILFPQPDPDDEDLPSYE